MVVMAVVVPQCCGGGVCGGGCCGGGCCVGGCCVLIVVMVGVV